MRQVRYMMNTCFKEYSNAIGKHVAWYHFLQCELCIIPRRLVTTEQNSRLQKQSSSVSKVSNACCSVSSFAFPSAVNCIL